MNRMFKTGGGFVTEEAKEGERDGIPIGFVEGFIASFSVEENMFPDKFQPGSFLKSINDHKNRSNRPIRLNFMHQRDPIGGFPINTVKEDQRGLFGVGEIALVDERSESIFKRVKAGFLSDFSIGFGLPNSSAAVFEQRGDSEVRIISEATIFEGSIVDEPMNADAQITGVKTDNPLGVEDFQGMSARDLEQILASTGQFKRKAILAMVSELKGLTALPPTTTILSEVLAVLRETRSDLVA